MRRAQVATPPPIPVTTTVSPAATCARLTRGSIGRQGGQRQGRRLVKGQMRRFLVKLLNRHRDQFRVGAVARQAEDLERGTLCPLIVAPVGRWIDHHLPPSPRRVNAGAGLNDLAGAVGAKDHRERDSRVLTLANKNVPAIQRRRAQAHERLTRFGARVGGFPKLKDFRLAQRAQHNGSHGYLDSTLSRMFSGTR